MEGERWCTCGCPVGNGMSVNCPKPKKSPNSVFGESNGGWLGRRASNLRDCKTIHGY